MRRVLVVSTTRADLWPLLPVIADLQRSADVEVFVLATGSNRPTEVEQALADVGLGPQNLCVAPVPLEDASAPVLIDGAVSMTRTVGEAIARDRPDIVLLLGDRWEMLGVAQACTVHRIPIAHLHGGELTAGAFDDCIRHALTKLSHVHFVATEEYGRRVQQLGEESSRVHVTGAPALDRLRPFLDGHGRAELASAVGAELHHPWALMTYHPPTTHPDALGPELEAAISGCAALKRVVATFPGADPGSDSILRRLRTWAAEDDRVILVPSLGVAYAAALADADLVIGNSSSGIVEAPFFGVPVVNIGSRQDGRVRARAVIDVSGDVDYVGAAVARALDSDFRSSLPRGTSPYGDGRSAARIVKVLCELDLSSLMPKPFIDMSPR